MRESLSWHEHTHVPTHTHTHTHSAVVEAVRYMYTGDVEVDLTSAAGVMATANAMKLPLLRTVCEREIWQLMLDEGLPAKLDLLRVADRYRAQQLREKIIGFVSSCDSEHIAALAEFDALVEATQKDLMRACAECTTKMVIKGDMTQKPMAAYKVCVFFCCFHRQNASHTSHVTRHTGTH